MAVIKHKAKQGIDFSFLIQDKQRRFTYLQNTMTPLSF